MLPHSEKSDFLLALGRADRECSAKMKVTLVTLAVLSAAGCRQAPPAPAVPTEKLFVVQTDTSPALPEAEDDEPAAAVLHRGDVMEVQRKLPKLRWSGLVEGEKVSREAEVIELKLSPRGALLYGFASDVAEATVPTTAHYCSSAPKEARFAGQRCVDVLQRTKISSDLSIAYFPCSAGKCPVARAQGSKVDWTTIDGLADLHVRKLGGRDVLVGLVRWVKNQAQTGGSLVVLDVAAGLPSLGEVKLDEVDSSTPRVLNRLGQVVFGATTITFRGARREIDAATGKEFSSTPVEETWALDGTKLVRR